MNFQSILNPRNSPTIPDDSLFDKSYSLELSIYNNNNYNNNINLNTFFESSKNKLFEIEIKENNNYNKNIKFLNNSINNKHKKDIISISNLYLQNI